MLQVDSRKDAVLHLQVSTKTNNPPLKEPSRTIQGDLAAHGSKTHDTTKNQKKTDKVNYTNRAGRGHDNLQERCTCTRHADSIADTEKTQEYFDKGGYGNLLKVKVGT